MKQHADLGQRAARQLEMMVMTIKDDDGYDDDEKKVYIDEYKEDDDDVVYKQFSDRFMSNQNLR